MYKILIVDDEPLERKVIRYLLNQNNFPLDIYEAENGIAALNILKYEAIDILLSDIKMPLMDGLELSARSQELYPDIQIIFFSSYQDFSYAKRALSLNATNYILKPIDPEEFSTTMQKVISHIQSNELLSQKINSHLHITQNHILYKLINKTSTEHLKTLYPQLDLSFIYDCHRLFLIQLNQEYFGVDSREDDSYFPYNELRHVVPSNSYFINLTPSQSVLLFTGPDRHLSWYKNIAQNLTDYIYTTCKIGCQIAISNYFDTPDRISSAYDEAEQKLTENFFVTNNASNDAQIISTSDKSLTDANKILNQIETAIQLKDPTSLKAHINLLIHVLTKDNMFSQIYFRFQCMTVLTLLLGGLSKNKTEDFDEYATIISHSPHVSTIKSLLLKLTDQLADSFNKDHASPTFSLNKVIQYIHEHYSEDLSLETLAQKVYLSPHYLSMLFSKHNSCGISKYIKQVRLEKAKELLQNTNLPINEIAQLTGYSSSSYFCKSFFKDFEMTPENYRNKFASK
jgi:two-component system response regulator YesN